MKRYGFRTRSRPDPDADRMRPVEARNGSMLASIILFGAVLGVAPPTFALDRPLGGDWLVSALSAIAIAGVLAVNVFLIVRR
jgi:hypothetical protein